MAVLCIIPTLLATTNPSVEKYQNYIRQETIRQSSSGFGQIAGVFPGGLAGGIIAGQTIRTDYVFFSTYELAYGKDRLKILGITKNFFVLETPSR